MAIFHRPPTPPEREQPAIDGGAYWDPPLESQAVAGTGPDATGVAAGADKGASSDGADKGAPGDGSAYAAAGLLPEVQVSEPDRRRERRLVEAACRGDESAIEALYRTHFDSIYRYVLLRLGSPSAAEDVTSQVFLGMIRGLSRYRDQGKPFVAWLYGIAQKQVAFFQRKQGRAPNHVDIDSAAELVADSAGPSATLEQRETQVALAQALGKLSDGQREVILLRYILSLSVAETAAVVGRTEGAVKQLQLRGLATLKNLLQHEAPDLL